MRLVRRVLPSGRAEFTATFYVLFAFTALGMAVACVGLVATALS